MPNATKFLDFPGLRYYHNKFTTLLNESLPQDYQGATASSSGVAGLVPAAQAADKDKYLKGDGTWGTVADTKVNAVLAATTKAYLLGTSTTPTSSAKAVTAIADTAVYLDTTAGRLTAGSFAGNGENITLGTASAAVVTDANKKLVASATVSATELGYLAGATSSIQTQLNGKAADSDTVHKTGNETISGVKTFSDDINVSKLQYLGERSFTIGTQGTGAGTYLQINSIVDSKSVTIANQGTNNITLTSKGNITAAGTITGNKIVGDGSGLTALDASKITTGTIDIARLPAGALERLVTVSNETARFALTSSDVQLGDTVKQTDTGVMYYVVDTSKLNSAAGYVEYTAGTATSVPWSGITGKPTTIAGYGITDAKIASGTITLGSATITPLTASSTLDATKLSGTASVNTTGNAATVTGTAGTSTLAWNSEVTLYTVGGHEVKAKLPANPNSNWTTHLYAGSASNSTANATSATTNAATYIVVCDNSTARNAVQVTGTNGTTVSAVNGKLTIDSPALASVTNAQIDTLFA